MADHAKIKSLLGKFDTSGPRYTSYPTAPQWKNSFGNDDYLATIGMASKQTDEPLSIYVHYPFCKKLCYFCGCNKEISNNESKANFYLDCIEKEIELIFSRLDQRRTVSQIHWGGGTPSIMTLDQTRRSFEMLSKRFEIDPQAEIAMELDPRTTDKGKLHLLKSLGFNRISYGVQDVNDEVQRAINRDQSEQVTKQLYHDSRELGFEGVNLDLVYGLPKQTLELFKKTIQCITQLRPDRIALYSYAHLPQKLAGQRLIEDSWLPGSGEKLNMFLHAQSMLLDAGYVHIGMDHFILPEDELAVAQANGKLRRNFMGYTVKAAQDWVGFGMSAISFIENTFTQNIAKIKSYQAGIETNGLAIERGMKLSQDDLIRQFVISELMCNFQLDFSELNKRFSINSQTYFSNELSELEPFSKDDLVKIGDNKIEISEIGKIFIRNIAMIFDTYLKTSSNQVQYSKTI